MGEQLLDRRRDHLPERIRAVADGVFLGEFRFAEGPIMAVEEEIAL